MQAFPIAPGGLKPLWIPVPVVLLMAGVLGVTVGCFPDLYKALCGNRPDQVITLQAPARESASIAGLNKTGSQEPLNRRPRRVPRD